VVAPPDPYRQAEGCGVTAAARLAALDDLAVLVDLYRRLEQEMVALSGMWPLTSGLPEPIESALEEALADSEVVVIIGQYDSCPFGFLLATVDPMHPQARGEKLGSIRLVFVDHEAREVGIGEAMRLLVLDELRGRGIRRFDAHVLPGHRLAKNFYEQGGFSARHIVMHHDDDRE
jgi:GNAT superfamily N-acetyltransferase